ncbi:ArdC-like ssDNA-binding domain-containing protein [Paludicola sp. MB14-C6]|uniref:ArdC-like ssDNA-binding domain-containing protein n=1 Tax=Paludihabitans sp. MB14-C6 TaxID=3070656 RepID=UPI0027DD363C|nr:ImmA/IrrE family metallo-endopeptidase [Paludicola sp. MB14-C6]WMJ22684.1 ArdC-like ssDNA-binding domain-containing protein [Paludicola sp. MB14-C6]
MEELPVKSVIVVPVQFEGRDYAQKRTMLIVGTTPTGEYICNNFTSDKRYKDNEKFQANVYIPKTHENGLKFNSYIKCDTQYIVPKDYAGISQLSIHITDDQFNTVLQRTSQVKDIIVEHVGNTKQNEMKQYTDKILETLDKFKMDPQLMKDFVAFSSKFYSYSLRNKMLIYMQNPFATFVASYTGWQQLGYNVLKGSSSLRIFRPIENVTFLRNGESIKISEATNEEKIKIGKGELKTYTQISYIKYNVFDISQTTCPKEDYPKLYSMGYASLEHKELYDVTKDFIETSGFTVEEKNLPTISLNGYCNTQENSIVINSKLNDTERLNTLLHEYAHGLLHKTSTQPTAVKEFEAESLSMMLHHRLGLEIDDNSKLYVCNSYQSIDKDLFAIGESFERLSKAFKFIEKGISDSAKSKGFDISNSRELSLGAKKEKQSNIAHGQSDKQPNIINRNFIQDL